VNVLKPALAALLALFLLLPGAAFAAEQDPAPSDDESAEPADEDRSTLDVMIERIAEAAEEAEVPVELVLDATVELELPDGEGGTQTTTLTVSEAIEALAGGTLLDEEENSGWAGTPWTNAGNVMHIAANLSVQVVTVPRTATDPVVVDVHPYSVVESDYTPDTPVVPVPNPLLLAGAVTDLPDVDDPLNLPLLLATHWGGRLKNVQGGDWSVLGAHSAGSHLIGTNLDTAERPEDDEAVFPFYAPVIDEGVLLLPDEAIDFAGFATVVNSSDCSRTRVLNIPFTQNMIAADICLGVGVLLGDGASFFNGEGPVDLRDDLAPLWEPAPEELQPALDAVDEVVAQIPVGEVLEQVLELLGGVDLPGDEEAPQAATPVLTRTPLKGVSRLLR
jgi:hypothetical protein